MQQPFITASNLTVQYPPQSVLHNAAFTMHRGEQWLLTGEAGSGKTTLAKAICGKVFHQGELMVHFSEQNSLPQQALFVAQWYHFTNHAGISDFYYQQRYNSSDAGDANTVWEELTNAHPTVAEASITAMLQQLNLTHRTHASLLLLSNGEQKKLQLAKAFLTAPQLLVLDNPLVGLDVDARKKLNAIFSALVQQGTQLIIIGDTVEIPACITHVATISNQQVQVQTREAFGECSTIAQRKPAISLDQQALHNLTAQPPFFTAFQHAVQLNNVHVQYGDKKILQQVNWHIAKGSKWWLQGANGAGKSTLLNLITGDHPQAYANDIHLFDKKRGTGESIWDIKQKIGYASPELHWYFDVNTSCRDVVLSGYFDTTGLYRKVSDEQVKQADAWLYLLQLDGVANKKLSAVSISQQRLLLLARALIKNPPLLILDEPCQGLDDHQTQQFTDIVDALVQHPERTLIYVSHRKDQVPACINQALRISNGEATIVTHQPEQYPSTIS
ncbi:ATP-binding cassette domain-containing protein [Deminuibacter soli]|uniref:ATP-binding cassette domain-containing protein n=1 Tax=Deminuibacter soli TaxID=2291815 RepID=A0A3E1NHY2_9BACT|nr:ATP-binding cassette domain-containing protein [Deminuibacter soli]RFM27539.1 ATP-binding cassette domain-containing protein [Deminuibacter soli]